MSGPAFHSCTPETLRDPDLAPTKREGSFWIGDITPIGDSESPKGDLYAYRCTYRGSVGVVGDLLHPIRGLCGYKEPLMGIEQR